MKNLTLRTSAIALAAATLCWHQAGHAAATESQLRSVVLYGNVSIQEDSTASWGPWTEFEAPAAGNTQPVTAPPVRTDPYRPLAQVDGGNTTTPPVVVTPVEGFCAGGSICGFGAFVEADPNELSATGTTPDIHPFRLNGTVVTPASEGGNALLPQTIQLQATMLSSTGNFNFADSGNLDLVLGEGGFQKYSRPMNGFIDEYKIEPDRERSSTYPSNTVQAINFNLVTYTRGSVQGGWGVIGYTTSTADMSALRASNAQATYSGQDYNNTSVNMTVNFGNGTWSGSWNGGSDGNVATQASLGGGTNLTGQVGFNAAGTVQGSTFSSTSVGTNDARATVTGSVQGAFFGPNAAAAGGVVDITKTVQPIQAVPTRAGLATPQAVAVQPGQGYSGRYVAPFIVTRGGD